MARQRTVPHRPLPRLRGRDREGAQYDRPSERPPPQPSPAGGGGSRLSVLRVTPLALFVRVERWPIAGSFAISRGAKTEAVVVVAELSDGTHRGRGECVPYARYGETVEGVAAA